MTDVHEVYVDKRRSRAGPIIGLTLVILLLIALVVAMIMNIHGSISWPAGELKFGFWPQATSEAPTRVASDVTVVIPESDVQAVEEASESAPSSETQQSGPPAPAETEPAPAQ